MGGCCGGPPNGGWPGIAPPGCPPLPGGIPGPPCDEGGIPGWGIRFACCCC